jgi:hypothetical protein
MITVRCPESRSCCSRIATEIAQLRTNPRETPWNGSRHRYLGCAICGKRCVVMARSEILQSVVHSGDLQTCQKSKQSVVPTQRCRLNPSAPSSVVSQVAWRWWHEMQDVQLHSPAFAAIQSHTLVAPCWQAGFVTAFRMSHMVGKVLVFLSPIAMSYFISAGG